MIGSATSVKPDLPIKYHTDGQVDVIIPELIEVGVTILNPVQPEAMDPVALKRALRRPPCLLGHDWDADDDALRHARGGAPHRATHGADGGRGGGLVLAPTHSIEPDVPWENVLAFYEAAEEAAGPG